MKAQPNKRLQPTARRRAGRQAGPSGTGVELRVVGVPTSHIRTANAERPRVCRTRRGDLGRHAEVPEDPADYGSLFNQRDQAQAATTPRTRRHIKPEGPLHQRGPMLATRSLVRRLRRVSLRSPRRARLCHRTLAAASPASAGTSSAHASASPARSSRSPSRRRSSRRAIPGSTVASASATSSAVRRGAGWSVGDARRDQRQGFSDLTSRTSWQMTTRLCTLPMESPHDSND